jgi:CheY-like chemotaxis protein
VFTVLFKKVTDREMEELQATVESSEVLLREMRILLVEDNEANRFLAKIMFQKDNHQIIEVENGLEALKILLDHHFDVILMDVQMPVMDGLTATSVIRACEQGEESLSVRELSDLLDPEFSQALSDRLKNGHIPIVALTAHARKEDKQGCLDVGMDGYAVKPFDKKDIYRVIQQVDFVGRTNLDNWKQQLDLYPDKPSCPGGHNQ